MIYEEHWVFKKHTKNMQAIKEVAKYLKNNKASISIPEKEKMYLNFSSTTTYNPRKSKRDKPLDAMNHKIDYLNYYMFGYSDTLDGSKKFIFSPLGNLFLSNLDNEDKLSKIFLTMLLAIQFPHPASIPSNEFKLYPFRLIFQLLLDERLERKLYHYEIYTLLIYQKEVTKDSYSKLVEEILESRKLSAAEKVTFLKDREDTLVKSVYEWEYYIAPLLSSVNLIKITAGDVLTKMYHPQKKGSSSPPTSRKATSGHFSITELVAVFLTEMLEIYSVYDTPLELISGNKKSGDIVKEIYSFYPIELLREIENEYDAFETELLYLPKLIEEYSLNPENRTADKFEDILEEAFNMFVNVEAKKLSGSGQTDIECFFLTYKETFAVEAKSTANKLKGINAGRLEQHCKQIGGSYTIVVTPRYVPSVKYDIKGRKIVIIKANTFSEYIYNNIIANNRAIDYSEIHDIVIRRLGTDISNEISELTLTKFG